MSPLVRYMLLCEDWHLDTSKPKRVTISGLLSLIWAPASPVLVGELCVFVILTNGHEPGKVNVFCAAEDGSRIFETKRRDVAFSNPLELVGVPFRIRNCRFPRESVYTIQFKFDGETIEERTLQVKLRGVI